MPTYYITPAELPTFYDKRRVLMLASDTGTKAVEADLSDATTPAYKFVNTSIAWASSEIDSHCQQGKRYARADLEAIATAGDSSGSSAEQKRAALLRQLVADLTYGQLNARRGYAADAVRQLCPKYEDALTTLEKLADGRQIFDLDGPKDSGVPGKRITGKNASSITGDNNLFGRWNGQDQYGGRDFFGRW